jgi:hypothetical protein
MYQCQWIKPTNPEHLKTAGTIALRGTPHKWKNPRKRNLPASPAGRKDTSLETVGKMANTKDQLESIIWIPLIMKDRPHYPLL